MIDAVLLFTGLVVWAVIALAIALVMLYAIFVMLRGFVAACSWTLWVYRVTEKGNFLWHQLPTVFFRRWIDFSFNGQDVYGWAGPGGWWKWIGKNEVYRKTRCDDGA